MKLIFATHNQNKVKELNLLLPESIALLSLNDINCTQEIEETGSTLEENALIKADFIRKKYGTSSRGFLLQKHAFAPSFFFIRQVDLTP